MTTQSPDQSLTQSRSDTPKTNAVAKMIGRLAYQLKGGELELHAFAIVAQHELDKLGVIERELNALSQSPAPSKEMEEILATIPHARDCEFIPPNLRSELQDCSGAYECTCWHSKIIRLAAELGKEREAEREKVATKDVYDQIVEAAWGLLNRLSVPLKRTPPLSIAGETPIEVQLAKDAMFKLYRELESQIHEAQQYASDIAEDRQTLEAQCKLLAESVQSENNAHMEALRAGQVLEEENSQLKRELAELKELYADSGKDLEAVTEDAQKWKGLWSAAQDELASSDSNKNAYHADLAEAESVIMATRQASIEAFNRIRVLVGAPIEGTLSCEAAVAQKLKDLNAELAEAQSEVARLNEACTKEFNSVCELNDKVMGGENLFMKLLADHNRLIAENLALSVSYQRLKEALKLATSKQHEGECVFTDKSDEGCYLCQEAENANWHIIQAALAETPDVSLPETIIKGDHQK